MACSGSGQDTVLTDEQLLDAVCGTNLGNQLDDLGVPVAAITTNDEERSCINLSTIASARCGWTARLTLNALRNGEQDAGNESLAVVGLLENSDLLAKTRAVDKLAGAKALRELAASHLRARLLVLERLELDSLDVHDGFEALSSEGIVSLLDGRAARARSGSQNSLEITVKRIENEID